MITEEPAVSDVEEREEEREGNGRFIRRRRNADGCTVLWHSLRFYWLHVAISLPTSIKIDGQLSCIALLADEVAFLGTGSRRNHKYLALIYSYWLA